MSQSLNKEFSYIPRVESDISSSRRVVTPEWMIKMDDLLSSTIESYEEFSELLGWQAVQGCSTKELTANQLFSTSAVQHSIIPVILPNAYFIPALETKMNTGTNIALIKIVRLANIGDMKLAIQEIEFENCRIDVMEQKLDEVILLFRPETRQNTIIQYEQNGTKAGQNVSKYNYVTGTGE